jgi:hypothetical protein
MIRNLERLLPCNFIFDDLTKALHAIATPSDKADAVTQTNWSAPKDAVWINNNADVDPRVTCIFTQEQRLCSMPSMRNLLTI